MVRFIQLLVSFGLQWDFKWDLSPSRWKFSRPSNIHCIVQELDWLELNPKKTNITIQVKRPPPPNKEDITDSIKRTGKIFPLQIYTQASSCRHGSQGGTHLFSHYGITGELLQVKVEGYVGVIQIFSLKERAMISSSCHWNFCLWGDTFPPLSHPSIRCY